MSAQNDWYLAQLQRASFAPSDYIRLYEQNRAATQQDILALQMAQAAQMQNAIREPSAACSDCGESIRLGYWGMAADEVLCEREVDHFLATGCKGRLVPE